METAILFKSIINFLSREVSIKEQEEILQGKKVVMKQILESNFDFERIEFGENKDMIWYTGYFSNFYSNNVQILCYKLYTHSYVQLWYFGYAGMNASVGLKQIGDKSCLENSLNVIKKFRQIMNEIQSGN